MPTDPFHHCPTAARSFTNQELVTKVLLVVEVPSDRGEANQRATNELSFHGPMTHGAAIQAVDATKQEATDIVDPLETEAFFLYHRVV
ncbi:hypothetical protein E2562_015174 [Oryza meyeriana var. granulata]|uniref:Uncharacterized protein n=1 Tax=Oryza meyeriana var. granulata TaxID=110450 RepID=A0A6G1EWU9_9ORYZ|nr:hypothetical protein E2562_015174 [Oryza meyeriana var. granulata]